MNDTKQDATPQANNATKSSTPGLTSEASPSTGWRETAALMHATAGRGQSNREREQLDRVDGGTGDVLREHTRCSADAKDSLEVSS